MIFKILLISLFLHPDTSGSDLKFTLLKQVHVNSDFFTTDRTGNIYSVIKDELTKYNPDGDSLYSQSFKTLGAIRSIDASNALRVFLFYPELTKAVMLDNTLSLQGNIVNLERFNLQFATLMCQSLYYNQLWFYTTDEFRLVRVDYQFDQIRESGNLAQIIGKELNPTFLTESDQRVYLNDPENGVHVFDLFGTFIQTLQLRKLSYFQVLDKFLYYLEDNTLHAYNLMSHLEFTIDLPVVNPRYFRVEKNRIYILEGDNLSIYSIS